MSSMVTDCHAHILDMDTVQELKKALPATRFELTPVDDQSAHLYVSDVHQFPFPRGAWDMEKRSADMKASGFDRQVVAVCPQTLLYDQETQVTLTAAQIQNAALGRLVRRDSRFEALATVPMQDGALAAAELKRAMRDDGLVGVMIGSHINGVNLDHPQFEPFWQAAERLRAIVLVHPVKPAGSDRQKNYYLKNSIGNPLDTTIAAASLVYGGVMERYPDLRVVLSHGGGFAPYQIGRFRHAWSVRDEGKVHLKSSPDTSFARFYYDSILHDPRPLRYLLDLAGADHIALGSDYPFDMGQYDMLDVIRSASFGAAAEQALVTGTIDRLIAEARAAATLAV